MFSCSVCNKKTSSLCSGCFLIPYCSLECQLSDRPKHKAYCIKFTKTLAEEIVKANKDTKNQERTAATSSSAIEKQFTMPMPDAIESSAIRKGIPHKEAHKAFKTMKQLIAGDQKYRLSLLKLIVDEEFMRTESRLDFSLPIDIVKRIRALSIATQVEFWMWDWKNNKIMAYDQTEGKKPVLTEEIKIPDEIINKHGKIELVAWKDPFVLFFTRRYIMKMNKDTHEVKQIIKRRYDMDWLTSVIRDYMLIYNVEEKRFILIPKKLPYEEIYIDFSEYGKFSKRKLRIMSFGNIFIIYIETDTQSLFFALDPINPNIKLLFSTKISLVAFYEQERVIATLDKEEKKLTLYDITPELTIETRVKYDLGPIFKNIHGLFHRIVIGGDNKKYSYNVNGEALAIPMDKKLPRAIDLNIIYKKIHHLKTISKYFILENDKEERTINVGTIEDDGKLYMRHSELPFGWNIFKIETIDIYQNIISFESDHDTSVFFNVSKCEMFGPEFESRGKVKGYLKNMAERI